MQEPYEVIESYLAGNVRGRTQIPYGAGVHQEAICPPWRKARIAARRYPTQSAVRTDAFLQKLRHDGSRLGYRMNWHLPQLRSGQRWSWRPTWIMPAKWALAHAEN